MERAGEIRPANAETDPHALARLGVKLVRAGQSLGGAVEGEDGRPLIGQPIEIKGELALGAELLLGMELALLAEKLRGARTLSACVSLA
ncbi:MAG TPA: hypothetical protein VF502_10995 [Stellaceae bacterium]